MASAEVTRIINELNMLPHPEGGYYVETFREEEIGGKCASTAIYYLLDAGDRSHWHRVHGSSEVWHYYSGGPLQLTISEDGQSSQAFCLGPDFEAGERPQVVVPAGHWQTAETLNGWTLVGCTVVPGFEFDNFEMAPEGWQPGQS